jgi:hypothetical protein
MEQTEKKPYKSKTVLVNVLVALSGIVSMLGFAPEAVHAWMQSNVEILLVLLGGIGTVLRLVTKDKLVLKD